MIDDRSLNRQIGDLENVMITILWDIAVERHLLKRSQTLEQLLWDRPCQLVVAEIHERERSPSWHSRQATFLSKSETWRLESPTKFDPAFIKARATSRCPFRALK